MPTKMILKNCQIVVNGVDFSDHVNNVEIMAKKASIDTTNFSGGGKEAQAGLMENQFVVQFQQDFNTAEVDQTLWPLWLNETEFTVTVKPTAAANSPTNPAYSGTCILLEYAPLNGKPGDLSVTKVTFPVQRGTFARATS